MKICREVTNLVEIGQEYRELYMKTSLSFIVSSDINSLNTELNPLCHLLALLEAHHFLHVSRMRVKPP
jgi:hypothetical protein